MPAPPSNYGPGPQASAAPAPSPRPSQPEQGGLDNWLLDKLFGRHF
jgi:hypothetical protein